MKERKELPWRVENIANKHVIVSKNNYFICECEEAELIVRTVNNFDKLVDALKDAIKVIKYSKKNNNVINHYSTERLEQTLKKAG